MGLSYRYADLVDSNEAYGRFTQGMRELGCVAGRNLVIELRSTEGKIERLPELAAELVRLNVDILVTAGTVTALAAHKATTTVPLVCVLAGDPVELGLVKSLAHPGGNITGLTSISTEIMAQATQVIQ